MYFIKFILVSIIKKFSIKFMSAFHPLYNRLRRRSSLKHILLCSIEDYGLTLHYCHVIYLCNALDDERTKLWL